MRNRISGEARGLRLAMMAFGAALALAVAAPAAAQRDAYILQPGDTVRMSVLGLPDLSVDATVDQFGDLRMPQIGSIRADGLTLDELESTVSALILGKVFRIRTPDANLSVLTIQDEDIFLSVVGYSPVTVTGDVRSPAVIDYRPGMTLRSALAAVGGVGLAATPSFGVNPAEIPGLQADYAAAMLQRARLLAVRWRLQAALGQAADAMPNVGIDPAAAAPLIERQRELLALSKENQERTQTLRDDSATQIAARLAILEAQEENQQRATEDDAEELVRVETLRANGIVPIQRLLEMRRAQLLSASRLLDTQNTIERVAQELTRLRFDDATDEETVRRELFTEMDDVEARLAEADNRIAALRSQLELSGALAFLPGVPARPTFSCVLFRRGSDAPSGVHVTLDTVLQPGDVVEFAVDPSAYSPWDPPASDAAATPTACSGGEG